MTAKEPLLKGFTLDPDESDEDPRVAAVAPILDALKSQYGDVYLMDTRVPVVCKMPSQGDWDRFLVEKIDDNPIKKTHCCRVMARSNVVWCEGCPVDGVLDRKTVLAAWDAIAKRYPALPDSVGADLSRVAAGEESAEAKKL